MAQKHKVGLWTRWIVGSISIRGNEIFNICFFLAVVSTKNAALSSATQQALSSEFGTK